MTLRNLLRQGLAATLLVGMTLFSHFAFAQDNSKVLPTDSKIRNIDGVAAVVNTGYITRKEIDDRITALQKQGTKLPDGAVLRQTVMERLIIEKIQLQNAAQEGVIVSNKELDKIIADIASKNKLSLAELKVKVEATGSSFARYKQLLRDDIVISRYREREVEGKIKISDAEIDNFISDRNRAVSSGGATRSAPAAKGGPEEIDVAQIFVPAEAGAGAQAEAKKKAELILLQARGDIDFMQLGALSAKENPKIKFQELGYRTPERLPQLFYEAIRNTGGGQLASAVVKSPAGYHVLKVLDRRALVVGTPEVQQVAQQEAAPTTPRRLRAIFYCAVVQGLPIRMRKDA